MEGPVAEDTGTDMGEELVGEHLHQTLDQEALSCRECALLPVGGAPGSHQDQLENGVSSCSLPTSAGPRGSLSADRDGGWGTHEKGR